MADPVVHITAGVPDSGTGNITTLGAVVALLPAALGAGGGLKIDGSGSAVPVSLASTTITGNVAVTGTFFQGTQPVSLASVPSHAVTNAGTFAVQSTPVASAVLMGKVGIDQTTDGTTNAVHLVAGTALIGSAKLSDGTNTATVKAASTAPVTTDTALVVAISPNSVNANGLASPANSAPVVAADGYAQYETVAASQTAQAMGATGAAGDYLAGVLVFPGTAGCGVVTILDNATVIGTFPGGGTTALPSLVPFMIPIGLFSVSGAWKITTGANVTACGVGKFT